MATLFIFILLVASMIFLFFKKLNMGLIFLLITLFSFLAIGTGLLPFVLLRTLQSPFFNLSLPKWKNKNVIVLLGAGTIKLPNTSEINPLVFAYSRIDKAAHLYFNCIKKHSCIVLVSGGDALHTGMPEAMVYEKVLLGLGVKNSDIMLEKNSLNTYKNAELTSIILNKEHFDQVILVTSGIHLKRSLLYFSHFGIQAIPVPADYLSPLIKITPLGYNFALTDFSLHEYLGIARYYIYNYFNWNVSIASPGVP